LHKQTDVRNGAVAAVRAGGCKTREWELCPFGLALFTLASVPIAWLLHGFSGVTGAWNVIPLAAFLIGAGWWLRRKRVTDSRPFLGSVDDR